jgi:hypothetical protein
MVAEGAVQQAKAFLDKFDAEPSPVPQKRRTRKSLAPPTLVAE